MKRVKELLKSSRATADLTVEALASKAGIRAGIIHRAEQGKSLPTPTYAKLLDTALELDGKLIEEVKRARSERAKRNRDADPPDPTIKGMNFVRQFLGSGPLEDRVRLLRQLTHTQSRAIREAIDVRLQEEDVAKIPMKDGRPIAILGPRELDAPALPVHQTGSDHPRRK